MSVLQNICQEILISPYGYVLNDKMLQYVYVNIYYLQSSSKYFGNLLCFHASLIHHKSNGT